MVFFFIFSALRDAESAIRLAAQWPKGYFRKGRALTGLEVNTNHPVFKRSFSSLAVSKAFYTRYQQNCKTAKYVIVQ